MHSGKWNRRTTENQSVADNDSLPNILKSDNAHNLPPEALDGLNEAQQRHIQDIWELCGQIAPAATVDSRKSETRTVVLSAAQRATSQPVRPSLRLVRSAELFASASYRFAAVAAALVVAVSVVLSPDADHYRAAPGVVAEQVSLSDGSNVLLAAGSRLTVPSSFGEDNRTVILHGEAFFDVQEGSLPFVVNTADAQTTVLGTSFNVRSWPGSMSDATHVIVESGRVTVSSESLESIVEPGEAITVSPLALTPVETNPTSRLAWRDGGFSYDNELIGTIIEDVERRFDVSVKAPASIRLRPVTIHRTEVTDAAEFIGDIAATISVRYRATANGFEMYLD